MTILYSGLLVFFIVHYYSLFRSRKTGTDIKRKIGVNTYMAIYSLISGMGLALIVYGYGKAGVSSYVYLSGYNIAWLRAIMMLLSLSLFVAANMPSGYMKHYLRHPMLISVALWSISHLMFAATYKQALLFGSFLLYTAIAFLVIERRTTSNNSSDKQVDAPTIRYDIVAIAIACIAYYLITNWLHSSISFPAF